MVIECSPDIFTVIVQMMQIYACTFTFDAIEAHCCINIYIYTVQVIYIYIYREREREREKEYRILYEQK